MSSLNRKVVVATAVAAAWSVGFGSSANAGVVVTQVADGATFQGAPAINTAGTLAGTVNTSFTTGVTLNAGATNVAGQTFTTTSAITLDQVGLYVAGGASAGLRLHLYSNSSGGGEADGFVNPNNPTPVDLLGGGAGVAFDFNGTPSQAYLYLDLTGTDEVSLAASTRYYLEVSGGSATFFLRRTGSSPYAGGNVYTGADPTTFRGNPAGSVRDAAVAVYASAVPEPTSLALLGLGGLTALRRRRA